MKILQKLSGRIAMAILASCCVPLAGRAADDGARVRSLVDGAIVPLMARYDVPGMAVAVTLDGQPFVFNYGLASREQRTPVSDATLFELGSVSKTFAATLASYAQVLGKLSLDDHPGKYMPQLAGSPIDAARLLHLGTYTAGGLPLQFPDDVTDAQMTDYLRQWQPKAAPGVLRQYSNPSIGLLGDLSALSLGRDFTEVMENDIFPQLGLKHTYVRVPEKAMMDYAWGYDKAGKPVRMNPGVLAAQAYGVRSTAADVLRFMQANIAPQQVEEPMRRALAGTQVAYYRVGPMLQGLGWEQYGYPVPLERLLAGNASTMSMQANAASAIASPQAASGPTLFNKTGSTNGFGSYVAFVPAKQIGIVLLANKNFPIPARVEAAHAILEQLARSAK